MDKKESLDKAGVAQLWGKIKEKFLGRDETTPVIAITKNEYDNLSNEDKKKNVIYTITDEPTPASDPFKPDTDKVPVGTVISFMGTTAPEGYLACDGATYPIASYPKLASFIKEQFGSFDHFGNNGAGTFGVPDLRNLFLRGFHGEAEEKLSGDVGAKQEATIEPTFGGKIGLWVDTSTNHTARNQDSEIESTNFLPRSIITSEAPSPPIFSSSHTSRPVNTAVLYCIKAYEPNNRGDEHSTEEQRIGTWIDGKPLYRKVYIFKPNTVTVTGKWVSLVDVSDLHIDDVIHLEGMCHSTQGYWLSINYSYAEYRLLDAIHDNHLQVNVSHLLYLQNTTLIFILHYTKTTD